MNKKGWLTLCGMLLALFLFLGVSPPGRASAFTRDDWDTDVFRSNMQKVITYVRQKQSYAPFRAYFVFLDSNYNRCRLMLSCEPDYASFTEESLLLTYNCDTTVESGYSHHNIMWFQFWADENGGILTDSFSSNNLPDDFYTFYDHYNLNWGLSAGSPLRDKTRTISYSDFGNGYNGFSDFMSKSFFASNWSFKSEKGAVFFDRTPLAANWLKIADRAIQEKLVEVRKNRPHLPELGQIQTGLMIVACCLVSLVLLTKLLRVWKNSLIR